jgi:hypothetical protein
MAAGDLVKEATKKSGLCERPTVMSISALICRLKSGCRFPGKQMFKASVGNS